MVDQQAAERELARQPPGVSDAHLVGQLAEGDREALEQLYDRFAARAYSLARRICVNQDIAQDILQEVFLALWREPQRYNPARGSFVSWLLTVVHHKSVDLVRRERGLRDRAILCEADVRVPSPPDEVAMLSLAAAEVRDALQRLPTGQRRVLVLAHFGGYTQREIAALVEVPLGTVKSRMYVGAQQLRVLLESLRYNSSETECLLDSRSCGDGPQVG